MWAHGGRTRIIVGSGPADIARLTLSHTEMAIAVESLSSVADGAEPDVGPWRVGAAGYAAGRGPARPRGRRSHAVATANSTVTTATRTRPPTTASSLA